MASYVIDSERDYTDEPFIIGYAWNKHYLDYYFDYFDSRLKVDVSARHNGSDARALASSLDSARVWIIGGHKLPNPDLLEKMERDYELISSREFIGASAYLFRFRKTPEWLYN